MRLGILLPPSEGKAPGGDPAMPWSPAAGPFGTALGPHRARLAARLARLRGGNQTLLGVGGAHLARAREANRSLVGAPTLPAAERYTGVVWSHLSPDTLPAAARRRAGKSVVVVSGLMGLVALDDPVPDYRLKMGAGLAPYGPLATWWRQRLREPLQSWAADRFVVDLLPQEHRAATTSAGMRGVAVRFVERSGKVAGHDAKAAKGLLARHLVEAGGDPLRTLKAWEHPRFDLELTTLGDT